MANKSARYANLQIFLAALLFSFSGVMGKWMPWGAMSLVGARALVAVVEMAIYRRSVKVRLNRATVLAGVSVALTSLLYMLAIKLTTAANAIVLQYAMPAVVILMCALFLRQMPSKLDVAAAALVMLGVILCFADNLGGGKSVLGDLLAFASAFTYAMVFFSARMRDCDPFDYTFLGNLITSVFAVNLFFDRAVTADPMPWLIAVLMGVLLSTGYLLFSKGMGHTSPVTAAILSNIEPVMNPIWVFMFSRERPGATAVIGACVVLITATAYSLLKQRRASPKPGLE